MQAPGRGDQLWHTDFESALHVALEDLRGTLLAEYHRRVAELEKELDALRCGSVELAHAGVAGAECCSNVDTDGLTHGGLLDTFRTRDSWRTSMGKIIDAVQDHMCATEESSRSTRHPLASLPLQLDGRADTRVGLRAILRSCVQYDPSPVVEAFVGFVIVLNVITLGLSMDVYPESIGWVILDVFFALVFLSELIYKLRAGATAYFFGEGWRWNVFELSLVVHAIFEIPFTLASAGGTREDNPESLLANLRFVRLIRFARILRLVRLGAFKELSKIVTGAVGGVRTLFWSIVIILVPLYMIALALRDSLGDQQQYDESTEPFSTMPGSMFTVFRCIVAAECTTDSGQPLFALVSRRYGWGYAVLYCISMLLVVFGLFNVITAIYIDNTLTAAKYTERKLKQMRLLDQKFVARKLAELLQLVWQSTTRQSVGVHTEDAYALRLTPEQWEVLRKDEEFQNILRALDITDEDQVDLFDIFDVDGSGTVEMDELLIGLTKMRGDARRSDIVGVILNVRAIRVTLDVLCNDVAAIRDTMRGMPGRVTSRAKGQAGTSTRAFSGDMRGTLRSMRTLEV